MASPAAGFPGPELLDRAVINRANAQHSTGPRTEAGKSRVRLNAFQHGLYSKVLVLPWEDEAAFQALGKKLIDQFQPQTPEAVALVRVLQETSWKLDRIAALEINLHTLGAQQHLDAVEAQYGPFDDDRLRYALAQVSAFQANSRAFDQLSRHGARLHRLFDAKQKELLALTAPTSPAPALAAAPNAHPEPEVGFVPRVLSEPMPKFTGPMAEIKRKQWLRRQAKFNIGS